MTLPAGTRFGSYEIAEPIGAGGMGEVYRATDTNLKRHVAIKVLPSSFASDTERLARFQREAEVLATLNHVNIAHIYGLERSGGTTALAMELVAGPTLAERIAEGPIPVDEALELARQIAEALDAAHARGIVHRDLKPANIKLTADGTVKVLDFGIAKALDRRPTSGPQAPLTMPAMTEVGSVLGTAAYMSPEQARGQSVDERADIWAFGCVLYEMLTGQPAFGGEDVPITLSRVLAHEADMNSLPAGISSAVRRTIELCLEKDPKKRIADISDVRFVLEGRFETVSSAASVTPQGRLAWMGAFAVVAVVAAALAIPAWRHLREIAPPAPPETRLEINTPPTDLPASFALSPDGRQIVFVASGGDASQLWLRSLATTTAQPLARTDGASLPFWSPDGRSIGFFAGGMLKRLDLGGGAPLTLAPAPASRGGTWNADAVILFAPNSVSPLMRVSATGGSVTAVTTLGPQQQGHTAPHFLPDGRRFLFRASGAPDKAGIYLGALDGSAPTRLAPGTGSGAYLPSGWLLWVRAGGTLVGQRLDLAQAALTGEPVTLADGVAVDFGASAVSVAATGMVAYRTDTGSQRQLMWMDRLGTALGTAGDPDGSLQHPRVSPDGRRVVVTRTVEGNQDIWLLDGARTSRFTFDAAFDSRPLWSPDGTRIVFLSNRTGANDFYEKLTSGAGVEELFIPAEQIQVPGSWSVDGFLLYSRGDPQTDADLWVVPMMGDRKPWEFLKKPDRQINGTFSPDGRWVAYQSNESGRPEIYIRPFIPPGAADTNAVAAGGQWQVSTTGGVHPVWRPDGQELYYLNPEGEMMAAPISVTASALEPGSPILLFPTRIYGGGEDIQVGRQYDVAPDGLFLINTVNYADAPITFVQNWNPDAKQ